MTAGQRAYLQLIARLVRVVLAIVTSVMRVTDGRLYGGGAVRIQGQKHFQGQIMVMLDFPHGDVYLRSYEERKSND